MSYNKLPDNFREIEESEFWHNMTLYPSIKTEFRQVRLEPDEGSEGLHMFYLEEDEGIGFTRTYNHGSFWKHHNPNKPIGFCAPLLYFKFSKCVHEWVSVPEESRNCYHVTKCTKCGKKNAVDSSG